MKISAGTVGRLLATLALCGATMGIVVGCGGGGGGADAGKSLYESKCAECHDLATVENAAGNYSSESEWADMVKSMQDQSTNISDDDAAAITAYLVANM